MAPNRLRLDFPTGAIVAAAVDDILVGNLGTCALVNLLPRNIAGEFLAELDAYRSTQTALALVSSQHLGGCNRHFAHLVLHILYRGVQIGIDRQVIVNRRLQGKNWSPTGTRKPFSTFDFTVFMYLATAALAFGPDCSRLA